MTQTDRCITQARMGDSSQTWGPDGVQGTACTDLESVLSWCHGWSKPLPGSRAGFSTFQAVDVV